MRTSRVTLPFIVLLVLFACTSQQRNEQSLQRVRSIINEHPDSALRLLDSLETYLEDFSQRTKMQWQMFQLSAQNKCYVDFKSDSIPMMLVDYFNQHGTSNERMTAHYLLGRAYSDMGEAPMALRCYQDAVECADTMAMDCDFYTLCSIYGQIALTFERQHLYREEIEAWDNYSHFALKDGDTYNYILGIELQEIPYYCLDDTLSLLRTMEKARHLYLENGQKENAAAVYSSVIFMLLQNRQYDRAYDMMQIYENESGLFDDSGNIAPGREHYYYCRGMYHLGVHQVDLAESYFRKLLTFQVNRNYDAYKGLNAVYRERQNVDSVMKYSTLCEQALDSIQKDDQSDALIIANSLYNYSRQEKIASMKALEAEQTKWRMTLIIILMLLSAAFLIYIFFRKYRRLRKTKERELGQMNTDYMAAVNKYEQLKQELQILEVDKNHIVESKQKEISILLGQIDEYKNKFEELPDHDKEAAIMGSEIVLSFKDMAKGKRNAPLPTDGDWQRLMGLFSKSLPAFYRGILINEDLTKLEKEICMLCRLNFYNSEIGVLLSKSTQSITNTKSKVNDKLFGQKSATSLKKNLVRVGKDKT